MSDILELLANTADGAFATDARGRIVYWNPAAEKILGYQPQEVLGRNCCDLIRGLNGAGELFCYPGCHVESLLQLGEPVQNYNLQTNDRSGRSRWLNLSTLAVPGSEPQLRMTVHFFRDITASRELESLVSQSLARFPASPPDPRPIANLTRREIETLRLLAHGLGTAAIAAKLGVSVVTARNHVQHILNKLAVHSRLEAVTSAWECGLLEPETAS